MTTTVNANLLRKWINKYLVEQERCAWPAAEAATIDTTALEHVRLDERQTPGPMLAHVAQDGGFARVVCASERPVADDAAQPTLSSFALALQANLPNGVRLELGKMTLEELTTIVPMLGRLPCSGSTKD
ncbi:hypothetical protein ACQUFY_02475 [Robbsia andropogonis]|uniref:hypothetical protein n=1 Tax=Robbsia andropogonis TaxID=28092 RepID=UPI003D196AA4